MLWLYENKNLTFATNNSERMRIDSSGRLLVGTSTARNKFFNTTFTPHLQLEGVGQQQSMFTLTNSIANTGGSVIGLSKQRSGTIGGNTIVNSGDTVGQIDFLGSDGTEMVALAEISAGVDGTPGANDMPGRIVLATTADGASSPTERLRITSTGAFAIEGASNYGSSGQVLTSNGNDAPTWQDVGTASVGGASLINMNDNVAINFGASNDLKIYHDGSNSYIDDAGTGSLIIRSNQLNIDKYTGEALARFRADGNCELFHNNNSKLTTESFGINVTGEVQCDTLDVDGESDFAGKITLHGDADLKDNGNLLIGTGNDLQIYHDGSHSYISNSTGYLHVNSANFEVKNVANNETMLLATQNGAVTLKYDNATKFATKSDGIDVTGEVQCDSLDVDGAANISGTTVFQGDVGIGNTTPGNSFDNGKSLAIGDNDTGIRQNGDGVLELWSNNAQCFRVRSTGNLSYTTLSPNSNNSLDLGSTSLRWRNVYTNDLNLSNEGSTNDVDGTWGNYTIQEGEDDLFLINRRSGKKYKFNLTEVS